MKNRNWLFRCALFPILLIMLLCGGAGDALAASEMHWTGGVTTRMESFGDGAYTLSEEELWSLWANYQKEQEYSNLAISNVTDYVNIRSLPNTQSLIVGKIYHGAVAQILDIIEGENGEWLKITSGSVEGYMKAEYFIYGRAAVEVIDQYVKRYVVVNADVLNVRQAPGSEEPKLGYLSAQEKAPFLEDCGDWIKIQYDQQKEGYVSADYVSITEEFTYAISREEELAEKKRLEELKKREQAKVIEQLVNSQITAYESSELRQKIVEFALQYIGNPYKNGGNSLTSGTDCSGFTQLVFGNFGINLGRTPNSQYTNAGRSVELSQIQLGDIICYGTGSSCTHVGIYIGDGQIVHAANPRRGIVKDGIEIETILRVKNVID